MLYTFQQEAGAETQSVELHQDQPAMCDARCLVSTQVFKCGGAELCLPVCERSRVNLSVFSA